MKASAIIPVLTEEQTTGAVVRSAHSSPVADESSYPTISLAMSRTRTGKEIR
jgi:hypothetical protein